MIDPSRASLSGRTALVTGGGAGIGRGIALGLAGFGARVAILELDAERATATADAIVAAGGDALAVPGDARVAEHWEQATARAVERFGGVDVLVNNAGGVFAQPFLESRQKGWDALLRANLTSVFHGTQLVGRIMVAQGRGGSIINVVSIEASRAAPLYAAYAAAKAGVVGFTKTMALELAPHRIRVNALAPDVCLTEGLLSMTGPADHERLAAAIPLGRAGVPDEVAGAAVFLASDLSTYVTGVVIPVDGGTAAAGGWYREPDGDGWVFGPPRRR